MFLPELSTREKYLFLELADKIITASEKNSGNRDALILAYEREMGLKNSYDFVGINLETIKSQLTDERAKRIIFLELLSLCMIGQDYLNENDLLNQIIDSLGFDSGYVDECKDWVKRLNEIYAIGRDLISKQRMPS